jgi:hypothetical protein
MKASLNAPFWCNNNKFYTLNTLRSPNSSPKAWKDGASLSTAKLFEIDSTKLRTESTSINNLNKELLSESEYETFYNKI